MWTPYKINEQINITEMYSLFTQKFENGYSFGGEVHNFWECLFVIEGSAVASGDERVYNLGKGDIIFHKPLEMHKFHIEEKKGTLLLIFSFSCEGKMSDFLKNKVFHLTEEQINILHSLIKYVNINIQKANKNSIIEKRFISLFNTSKTMSQMISTYICQLFLSLYEDNEISTGSVSPEALVFKDAVRYMKRNICEQISVSEIAEYCNISETGLKRIFSKYSNLGVHKYFLKLKINSSIQLLKEGQSVTQVSEALGFSNQGYFSYVFKRETGSSPTEYLKKINVN